MSFESQRDAMVRSQLASRDIYSRAVLNAMRRIERHRFVPESHVNQAYEDHPVFIGEGQTISQPYIVALMTQCLALTGEERVLEIGTGSGYQTAILAELSHEVYTVERIEILLTRAKEILAELDYRNIYFKCGDGTEGWAERSPFDGILVTAAAPRVPQPLFEQLAAGGRLVIPVGGRFTQQLQVIVKKKDGPMKVSSVCGCVFVPLVGREGWHREG